jgi:hypothetical protein
VKPARRDAGIVAAVLLARTRMHQSFIIKVAMHRATQKTRGESAGRDSRKNPVLASADETRSRWA